jgi:hypothetical protein
MDHLETLASDGKAGGPSTSKTIGSGGQKERMAETQAGPDQIGGDEDADPVARKRDTVDAWFVDLFVRCNNHRAVEMYEKLGYSVFRRVVE